MTQANDSGDHVRRRVQHLIRDIPDYPQPGILFKDITPLLASAADFQAATDAMSEPFQAAGVTHVVAIESRGFILGGPIALRLRAGFVPVRKPGKLPSATRRVEYSLEYGTDCLEVHDDAFGAASRVLIVDDVLATGGTAEATCRLVMSLGASVVGFTFLIALSQLPGRARLHGHPVHSVVTYYGR